MKDAMSRDIFAAFDEAGIGIASATVEIVGLPPLRVQRTTGQQGQIHERTGSDER